MEIYRSVELLVLHKEKREKIFMQGQGICKATTKKNLPCKKHTMKRASFCYIHSLGRFHEVPIWRNATLHFIVGILITIIIAIVSIRYTASRSTQNEMFKKIDFSASLLDDIWLSQHESTLLQKYPAGYVLFGIDPNSLNQVQSEMRLIPRKGHVLEEYSFKWDQVAISELTDVSVTIDLPNIIYMPLKTSILGCTMKLNRKTPGKSFIFPVRPVGVKNRIFVELAYDSPSFLVFAIGFKPE